MVCHRLLRLREPISERRVNAKASKRQQLAATQQRLHPYREARTCGPPGKREGKSAKPRSVPCGRTGSGGTFRAAEAPEPSHPLPPLGCRAP